jgi:hypothetical protein
MYIVIIIAFTAVVMMLLLHRRYEAPPAPYLLDPYEVFKKTRIGQKLDRVPTPNEGVPEATPPQKMASLRKTSVRQIYKKTADTRYDLRRKRFLRYCEEKKEVPAADNPTAVAEEKTASMVIPIMQDKSTSDPKTGEITAQAVQGVEVTESVNVLPRDTDRFDSQFYKKNLEAQFRPANNEKDESSDAVFAAPTPQNTADQSSSPGRDNSALLGETACQINEMESLCQEIDRIIEFIQQKSPDEKSTRISSSNKELLPNFQKNFQEKVDQAFANGDSQCLQDFDKILEDLHLPHPEELLRKDSLPANEFMLGKAEMSFPSEHMKIPLDHSESIEIWKKMLGFK